MLWKSVLVRFRRLDFVDDIFDYLCSGVDLQLELRGTRGWGF
jgi:hypothetical protein